MVEPFVEMEVRGLGSDMYCQLVLLFLCEMLFCSVSYEGI